MAFRKTLAHRFLHIAKTYSSQMRTSPSIHPPSLLRKLLPDSAADHGLLRRFLQRRAIVQAAVPPDRLALPLGDKLVERIRSLTADRIRLDGLAPPPPASEDGKESKDRVERGISIAEVRKILKAAQLEMARSRLRSMQKSCIPHSEFLKICCEVSGLDQGSGIARSLDESGTVIVFGDVVFLRPDQVAKAIESAIPLSAPSVPTQDDQSREEELRAMEEQKAVIDRKANAGVKRELWGGLGFLVVQTLGFMRLTFWELSWDVMEPICFYVTSFYFMAGYGFFMRTSKEPSFEGFFQSRFASKQKRLMKAYNFDLSRFNQLKRSCTTPATLASEEFASSSSCDCCRDSCRLELCAK